jgi:5'-nucleotidase
MRRPITAAVAVALGLGLASAAVAQTTVKIIGFNDFHGNLQSPGTFRTVAGGSTRVPAGGADYFAGYIASLKAQNPNNVVVAAGDLVGASPLVSAFFHDEGTIEVLNRMGLEFASVGNHEFDAGQTELLRKQRGGCAPASNTATCQGNLLNAGTTTPVPFEGAKFKYLSANVVKTATGASLLPSYGVKTFNGHRIGFIGMTLKDTPTIVSSAGIVGLQFNDEAATANALVPRLLASGAQAIVILIHQGTNAGVTYSSCQSSTNTATDPIASIVAKLDDHIGLVVSGHSHNAYVCRFPNSVGRNIPVTQAASYGNILTNIDVTLNDQTGAISNVTASNIVVDRTNASITPNNTVAQIVQGYANLASPLTSQIVGTILSPGAPNSSRVSGTGKQTGEKPAGDLIADAQLAAASTPTNGSAVIALMNTGGVRANGFINNAATPTYPYNLTYGDAFTVQPFGNLLQTITLTAQQLRTTLEQQFGGCLGQTAGTDRILQISKGLYEQYDYLAACGSKIQTLSLNGTPIVQGGVVLNPTQTFQVVVNNFMYGGGDNFTTLTGGLNPTGAGQDIDALVAYLANYKAPNAPYDPTSVAARIVRVN